MLWFFVFIPEILKLFRKSLRSSSALDTRKLYGRFHEKFPVKENLMPERDCHMAHLDNFRCHVYGLAEPCRFSVININMHDHEEIIVMVIFRYINPFFCQKLCPCTLKIPEVICIVDNPSSIRVFIVNLYLYPVCRLRLRCFFISG